MLKKNTRKRLLAGALATVMMLTMCPTTWALADAEDIATPLPLVDESLPVVDSAPVEADTTKTPDVPSSSEPEVQEPTVETPSAGQDIEESGNNNASSDVSEDNSQNNSAADSTPDVNDQPQDAANEANSFIDGSDLTMEASMTKKRDAEMWITNRHAADKKGKYTFTIRSDIEKIDTEDGVSVASLVEETREAYADNNKYNTVFWQARVHRAFHHQGTGSNDDKTQLGTEITNIRYKDGKFEYRAKDSGAWTKFALTDQLVFYYLIRTEYSQMVQIDVSDWTVDKEDTQYPDRRSVTYQVIVDGGVDDGKPLASRKFWYNKAFKVSSVRVREIGNHPNYTIHNVELEPGELGEVNEVNGEYQFSLDLTKTKLNATVNIYVSAQKHNLSYDENGGKITSSGYTQGEVYPDMPITVPTAKREGYNFDGWYDETTGKPYVTGDLMPGNDLKLTARWTANTPTQPEPKLTEARYFVLLPTRTTPTSGASQGWTSYLPNETSDGGVKDVSRKTGYKGHLTPEGQAIADANRTDDDSTNGIYNVNGFGSDYLVPPTELGFFDKKNWSENGTTYIKEGSNTSNPFSVLGDNFNVNNISIVWYTIKYQGDEGSYHVDGYVTGVPVTVTYHPNYGTIPNMSAADYVVPATSGDTYTVLDHNNNMFTAPEGYTFGGWYTDPACTLGQEVAVGSTETLRTDWHLYAKWVPDNFKVSYYVDGVQDGEIEDHAVDSVVSQRDEPTMAGHTFSGWTPATDVASIINVVDGKFTMPAQNVRFNGTFVANKYTVNWVYEDGTAVCDPEQVEYNTTPKSDPQPTKADDDKFSYTFKGWKVKDGDDTFVNPKTTPVTANVTYVAVFESVTREYHVTYLVGGTEYAKDTYKVGADVVIRDVPTKEGHTFKGWKIGTENAKNFKMPADNVVINGTFAINRYTVTYKVDGKEVGTDVYDFNSDVVIRDVPTKEGYTFSGWKIGNADAKNFKMPADNVVINGTFAINRYTVTYKVDTEVVGTDVYDFNSDVVIRPVPTKEGYTFSGWKIDTADAENFKMPAHDVTIEGTFAKNSSGGHHRRPTVTIPDKVPTGLNGNDHYAYIVGYPDKTVRPQNGITRAEVATIFFRLLTDETRNANSTKSNSYSDVAAGAWYNHAVSTLSAMGIVKGDSDGKFNPNAPITRAEFAAIAARFDDKANTTTADFSDIASHWAKNEISAASNNGWINGYPDGTFRPDNKITRAEAMTLVNRVLKRLPETEEDLHDDMIKWSDNSDASQWFYLAVQEATNSHYYKAKENKFEKWSELRDTRDWTELEK